jgi:hypothetical protein
MVVPDFPRACMPDLRENQNQRPISTRNGNHEAINDIQSFIRNVSCSIAYKRVGRNGEAYSASSGAYTLIALKCLRRENIVKRQPWMIRKDRSRRHAGAEFTPNQPVGWVRSAKPSASPSAPRKAVTHHQL